MKPECPGCGSNDIAERNDCTATYPVTEIGEDGEPIAYGVPTVTGTQVVEDIDRYQCGDCNISFDDFDHHIHTLSRRTP